jgi:23S rRNA pseudouridine1911/1915/1917 synthase
VIPAALAGQRVDRVVAMITGISRAEVAALVDQGKVRVDDRVVTARSQRVDEGAHVHADLDELVAEAAHAMDPEPDVTVDVVYVDEHLIVVDKPAGLVVHPAPGHERGTLVNALLAHCRDLRGIGGELRPGIVHRIDKDTTGLLVVAKDDATMNTLGAAFKAHTVERVYEALVVGKPPAAGGRIDTLYGRDPRDRKRFSSRVRTGKRAVTNWTVVERFAGAARIEARLETGRTHQVRVHLAALGCPLLGDKTYGRPPRDARLRAIAEALGRQALHARSLAFVHPATGKRLALASERPADMEAALAALRAGFG